MEVGDRSSRRRAILAANPLCIFCGGINPATTIEHCPPRGMFRDRVAPEGFEFAACESCNGGSSNDDLMAALIANWNFDDQAALKKSAGLMKMVNRQFPGALPAIFQRSSIEARAFARRAGIEPKPGQLYRELGVAAVTAEMHEAVSTLAGKLTKALYNVHSKAVFPSDGGILFQWFTNAQFMEEGSIPAHASMAGTATMRLPLRRAGRDLVEQFDYGYMRDEPGELHALQVGFGKIFGFVTWFSQQPGRMESVVKDVEANLPLGTGPFPFKWLSTNRG